MAEKLFKQLETTTKRFEVKLMTLDVISRLIGLHNLFLFNFYPYVQRFMQPHQREAPRLLQFAAQASHELLPPDALQPLLKTLADNFVTERNSSDVMAIGLNAVREICARAPLAIDEDLLRDLAQYKNYRERPVMMAARSLIQLFRQLRPELLHKKDRGKPTEASLDKKARNYGEVDSKTYVPGAEVLLDAHEERGQEVQIDSGSDSDADNDSDWVDLPHSSDEDAQEEDSDSEQEDLNEEGLQQSGSKLDRKVLKAKRKSEQKAKKIEQAQEVSTGRFLTDADFKRIDMENVRKQIAPPRGAKRKLNDDREKLKQPSELVKLSDIENVYKKRRHDKETRLKAVREGQAGREKFGYKDGRQSEHCSRTNREKRKTKNFQMVKHKIRGKGKRSFKDKQIALRNHLIKIKKMR